MTLKEILEGAARAAEAGESGRAAMILREQAIPKVSSIHQIFDAMDGTNLEDELDQLVVELGGVLNA